MLAQADGRLAHRLSRVVAEDWIQGVSPLPNIFLCGLMFLSCLLRFAVKQVIVKISPGIFLRCSGRGKTAHA